MAEPQDYNTYTDTDNDGATVGTDGPQWYQWSISYA